MGVRLYTPTLGRFLTTDPVYGGNSTSYGYPTDPIGSLDLDGRKCGGGALCGGMMAMGRAAAAAIVRVVTKLAQQLGRWQYYSGKLGAKSRLFSDSRTPHEGGEFGKSGRLNPPGKDNRWSAGWSVKPGSGGRIQTVFRLKMWGKKLDMLRGPFRGEERW